MAAQLTNGTAADLVFYTDAGTGGYTTFTVGTSNTANLITFEDGIAEAMNNIGMAIGQIAGAFPALGIKLEELNPEVRQRARRLLEGLLPPAEVLRWDKEAYVEVPSRKWPGGVWRLSKRYAGADEPWIDLYLLGVKSAGVCLHVHGAYGLLEDSLVAKYLLARFAEEDIERHGNWTWYNEHGGVDWDAVRAPAAPELVFS